MTCEQYSKTQNFAHIPCNLLESDTQYSDSSAKLMVAISEATKVLGYGRGV